MKNREWKERFLRMLCRCMKEEALEIKNDLESYIRNGSEDFHDQCMVLFLVGEYTRITKDFYFYNTYGELIEKIQDETVNAAYDSCPELDGRESGFYISNYGMAYGALYNSNLFAKRETIANTVHEMKNYAYANYTCAGKLVNEMHGHKANAKMLWICVPFGLFTPEDLVLVAALPDMQDTEDLLEIAMLGWYFAEKADYGQAKSYLSRLTDGDTLVQAIGKIIEEKLRQAEILSESPITHIPCGNFNRYVHQNYEREPWFPKAKEVVYLNIATWPAMYHGDVEVIWNTNTEGSKSAVGMYQKEYENYRFSIGSFAGGEQVSYYFRIGDYTSETFCFTVLEKEVITHVGRQKNQNQETEMELRSDQGGIYLLTRSAEGETAHMAIKKLESQDISSKDEDWKTLNDSKLRIGAAGVPTIGELYFWKEGSQIFSTGMKVEASQQEGFFGFGERYNHINQRGNMVDVYVYNQYKDQGIRTYFPMPYFLSSDQYGMYLPTDHYTEFDLCCSEQNWWQVEAEVESLEWYCFAGTPKDMIGQFTLLTGRPVMMPEWAFGPWMSSNNWDSEAEVRKQAELTQKYDIPSTVLVIEAWSDEATYYIFNDAQYKENNGENRFTYHDFGFPKWGKWPDPKGMVEYLHENGMKCILWQIPIIKYINSLHHLQKDNDEGCALAQGYCVKNFDGSPYRMPEGWFTGSLLMDYTNPEATEWWMKKRQYLIDEVKIDGFKTDGGEFVFGDDVQFWDGRTGKEMRNEYPNLYIREHYQYIHEKRNGIVFSRAGFTGAAQMPAHWAGDEKSTFSAFRRNLCAGLNAGISGVPFWGWDLAGFSGEIPSAELFARSASMSAFCPIMQYHAESKAEFNQDRTPWNIAERRNAPWVIDVYRYYAKLRMAMMPYILEMAEKSVKTGVPLMRALWLEYPQDQAAQQIFDQYLFGEDFMVAPIVEEGKTHREVYIPAGNWRHMFTGEEFLGGREVELQAEVDEIIVLQKLESEWTVTLNGGFKFIKETNYGMVEESGCLSDLSHEL